jgi:hypothetical protein
MMSKKTPDKVRKILVVLSNRWNRSQPLRYFELEANEKGDIMNEKPLRSEPKQPVYDEVWENDEGRTDIASTNRFKRKYPHKLEKPKA